MRLLNTPDAKLETRIKTLKNLKKKMGSFQMNGLLADQKQYVDEVIGKIDSALKLNDAKKKDSEKQKNQLDAAIKDVQKSVEDLKSKFMKKVMDLQKEQQERMQELNSSMGKTSTTAEQIFDKLMEVQDAPLQEQLKVLKPAIKSEDKFVMKFLKRHGCEVKGEEIECSKDTKDAFHEHSNLAMDFGKLLDTKEEDDKKEMEAAELEKLEKSAHLKEDQAKSLLPILENIKAQQTDKQVKIKEVEKKLMDMEETTRFYKKHKANLKREDHVLGEAVDAIEHGKLKKLQRAMNELREMAH